MSTATFNPAMGIKAIEEAVKSASVFVPDRKVQYFGLAEDKASALVRFITDINRLPVVRRHDVVPTKPGPAGAKNWPKAVSAVCRRDPAFRGIYQDCYICDFEVQNTYGKPAKATPKGWGIACLRTDKDKSGNPLPGGAVRDLPRKVMIKGDDGEPREVVERSLVVVCQAPNNFWDFLTVQAGRLGDTVNDHDFDVIRNGVGIDTSYVFMAVRGRDEVLNPGNPDGDGDKIKWGNYAAAMETQGLDLHKVIQSYATDAHYARWFDPRYQVNDQGVVVPTGVGIGGGTEQQTSSSQSRIADMRAKANASAQSRSAMPEDDEPEF